MNRRDTLSHKLDMMYDIEDEFKKILYGSDIYIFSWLVTVRRTSKDRSMKGES